MADDPSVVDVLVEIPKGSRNKYEYDPVRRMVRYDRMLFSPVHYPADYGFLLETLAGDNDPLDALVLLWEPTFPGCVIRARAVGLFRMRDEKGDDDKVLCVPLTDPLWSYIERLEQVPPHLLREVEHFFTIYKELEGVQTDVRGWSGQEEALRVISACRERYRAQQAGQG